MNNDRLLSFLGLCKRAGCLISGAETVTKAVREGKALLVLYASDVSDNSLKGVVKAAEDGGVGIDWLKEHKTAWMLTSWQVKILRRPVFCEHVKIKTWACGFRHFLGQRNFTITNAETGELGARARLLP